jgi:hypothetical protein
MTDVPEGFARRWSRLKRSVDVPVATPPAPPATPPAEMPLEQPPPVETIPLEDIAAWMSRNVPEAWRQMALRRLWVSDSTIAGFIGPADYAWDWNTPGGAPGWGPMRALDDVARLLARAIGEAPAEPAAAPPAGVVAVVEPGEPLSTGSEPALSPLSERQPAPMRRRGGGATPV